MFSKTKLPALLLLLSVASLSSGCVFYVGGNKDGAHVSGIMGNIEINPNSVQNNLSMVNGNIYVGHHSEVKRVNTVNGNIEFEHNVKIRQAETVNGGIVAGDKLYSEGNLVTVNGSISLGAGAKVKGDVTLVNGDLHLVDAEVSSDLINVNGNIELKGSTLISGNIRYREPSSWFNSGDKQPVIVASSEVSIEGNIILERPVTLDLAPGVLKGKVIERYSDK